MSLDCRSAFGMDLSLFSLITWLCLRRLHHMDPELCYEMINWALEVRIILEIGLYFLKIRS